jgi:hypothetical protein
VASNPWPFRSLGSYPQQKLRWRHRVIAQVKIIIFSSQHKTASTQLYHRAFAT